MSPAPLLQQPVSMTKYSPRVQVLGVQVQVLRSQVQVHVLKIGTDVQVKYKDKYEEQQLRQQDC